MLLCIDPSQSFSAGSIGRNLQCCIDSNGKTITDTSHYYLWEIGNESYAKALEIGGDTFIPGNLSGYCGDAMNVLNQQLETLRELEESRGETIILAEGSSSKISVKEIITDCSQGLQFRYVRAGYKSIGEDREGKLESHGVFGALNSFFMILIELDAAMMAVQMGDLDFVCGALIEMQQLKEILFSEERDAGGSLQQYGNKMKSQRADRSQIAMQKIAMEIWAADPDRSTAEVGKEIHKMVVSAPHNFGLSSAVKLENVLKKIRPISPPKASKRGPKPIK
jgi:hypothetical protein